MTIDWTQEIGRKVALKLRLREAYKLIPHYLPEPPATEAQIREAEAHLGFPLDPQYREFLGFANGWKGFMSETDLFGTDELQGRNGMMKYAYKSLSYFNSEGLFEDTVFPDEIVRNEEILPIGTAKPDLDMFFVFKPYSNRVGQTLRIIRSEVDVYADFYQLFQRSIEWDQYFIDHGSP